VVGIWFSRCTVRIFRHEDVQTPTCWRNFWWNRGATADANWKSVHLWYKTWEGYMTWATSPSNDAVKRDLSVRPSVRPSVAPECPLSADVMDKKTDPEMGKEEAEMGGEGRQGIRAFVCPLAAKESILLAVPRVSVSESTDCTGLCLLVPHACLSVTY